MKKSRITKEDKIKWWNGSMFENDMIELAMTKAYRDLMRTIRRFSSNKNNNEIKKGARACIKKYIVKLVNSSDMDQEKFNMMHHETCNKLIEQFIDQHFTIGQAQKWINMTFKYLHLLEYEPIEKVYEYCHIPIDNYMLRITNYQMSKAWSKLDDYSEYLQYQEWFRNKYNDQIPLDAEFYLWLTEAKKVKEEKANL